MIIYRIIKLRYLRLKWKFAFYQFIDQQLKNPENFEKKLVHEIAEIIHHTAEAQPHVQK